MKKLITPSANKLHSFAKKQNMVSLHYSKAKKILVMNQKGGVGKSTCVVGLISHLVSLGHKVELIDFDKQRSSSDWAKEALPGCSQSYNPSLRSLSNIAATLKVQRDTEFVVFDSPSNFTTGDMARYTYFTNAILLPMSPSPVDLHASLPFIEKIISSGMLSSRKLSLAFIINRCVKRDARMDRTLCILKHFRRYPTLGKMSEDANYQDAFFYKRMVPSSIDSQLWQNVTLWLKQL